MATCYREYWSSVENKRQRLRTRVVSREMVIDRVDYNMVPDGKLDSVRSEYRKLHAFSGSPYANSGLQHHVTRFRAA